MNMSPRMLTVAREAQSLTQVELSKKTGLSQPTLSKAENGTRPLSEVDLPRVAQALRVTPELLCWPDETHGFGSASFFHRKQQSLSQKTLRKIQARVNLLRMRLARLMTGLEIEASRVMPRLDPDECGGPSGVAKRLRAMWRIPMGPLIDLVDLVESANGIVVRRDFGTHRINAISVWHPGLGPLFVLNHSLTPERQRFILAHELGHMIMHEGEPPREHAEREADEFAEELLMPAAEITRELLNIDVRLAITLKPYWRVPMQSLIIRAEHLDVISQNRCRSLHAYMNKAGYLASEPLPLQREEPQLVRDMLEVQISDHGNTLRDLARVLGMLEEDLASELPLETGPALRIVK